MSPKTFAAGGGGSSGGDSPGAPDNSLQFRVNSTTFGGIDNILTDGVNFIEPALDAGLKFGAEAASITMVGNGDGFADSGLFLDCADGYFFLKFVAQADVVVKDNKNFRTKNANSTFFHTTSLSAGSVGLNNLNDAVGLFGSLNVGSGQAFKILNTSTDVTAAALLGLVINEDTSTEPTGVMGVAIARVNNAPIWGGVSVAASEPGLTGTKLVGHEIDLVPDATSAPSSDSGGLFINVFNRAMSGPALQTGGITGGTFGNGIVIEEVVAGGAQIIAKAKNGADCIVALRADNNDDATDEWLLKVLATGNSFTFTNNGSVLFILTTAGLFTVPTVQPSTGYNAVDGTAGATGTATGPDTIAYKNGLATTITSVPVPAVKANRSANQSIGDATATAVIFDEADTYDTDTMHDPGSNNTRVVFKTAGVYVISGFGGFAANAVGPRFTYLATNTGQQAYQTANTVVTAGIGTNLPVTMQFKAAVNDYVEFFVYQNSTGNLNFSGAALTAVRVAVG